MTNGSSNNNRDTADSFHIKCNEDHDSILT